MKSFSVSDSATKMAYALGAGFVLGCHLGSYFLSGVVLIVMVGTIILNQGE